MDVAQKRVLSPILCPQKLPATTGDSDDREGEVGCRLLCLEILYDLDVSK